MTAPSRSHATAPLGARLASGLLPPSYTTTGDVTRILCYSPLYHDLMNELCGTLNKCVIAAEDISRGLSQWFKEHHELAMKSWREHVVFLAEAQIA